MPSPPTPAEIAVLLDIFNNKDGLFRKTDSIDLNRLINLFDEEVTRLRQFTNDSNLDRATTLTPSRLQQIRGLSAVDAFSIPPVPISSIQAFIDSLTPSLSYLAIYYGFDLSTQKIVLVMQGIRLDGSGDGRRLANKLLENQVSETQITTTDFQAE